jgi:head-tail adaptor
MALSARLTARNLGARGAKSLNKRVAFQKRVAGNDGAGNVQLGDWSNAFPPVAASIDILIGGEQVMQSRLGGRQPVLVIVRYSPDTIGITTDMRLRDQRSGQVYDIKSVADVDGSRRWLDVLCETGTDA